MLLERSFLPTIDMATDAAAEEVHGTEEVEVHTEQFWEDLLNEGVPYTWNGFQKWAAAKCRELGIRYATDSVTTRLRRKKYLALMTEFYPANWLTLAMSEEKAAAAARADAGGAAAR